MVPILSVYDAAGLSVCLAWQKCLTSCCVSLVVINYNKMEKKPDKGKVSRNIVIYSNENYIWSSIIVSSRETIFDSDHISHCWADLI